MNKVDLLVKRALLSYPSLFDSRVSVLCNLFTTCGNGYEWVNGELISDDEKTEMPTTIKTRDITEHQQWLKDRPYINDESRKAYDLTDSYRLWKREFTQANIDVMAKHDGSLFCDEHEIYLGSYFREPSLKYSRGFALPDEIDPDWIDALLWFYDFWLRRTYWKYHYWPDNWGEKEKESMSFKPWPGNDGLVWDRIHEIRHKHRAVSAVYLERQRLAEETWNQIKDNVLPK